MLRAAFLFSALAVCSAIKGDEPKAVEKVVFHDPFSGKLAKGWTWVRETTDSPALAVAGAGSWRVFQNGLVIRVLPGYLHAKTNNSSNILLRPLPDTGDRPVAIEVALRSQPMVPYEHAGLVWYYDDDHYVALFREFLGTKPQVLMVTERRANPTFHYGVFDGKTILLRLEVSGGKITGKFREPEEEDWHTIGHSALPLPAKERKARVGLHTGGAPPGAGRFARFWDFRIMELMYPNANEEKAKAKADKEKN
jgi:hypothetical protein